ncbi:HpyAIV family type II restriction enzyme [Mycoplasmopsis hyopharyngis]|uniref:HpyAIV family type II restriction enzyme n=1 Tax=Mycoplasmopsis hyopharyngis TaxID=29558 RepID=UPI003873A0DA
MDFDSFKINLKEQMNRAIHQKMIYKLIDAPYRFKSLFNPLSVFEKVEQSRIKSQEFAFNSFLKSLTSDELKKKSFVELENRYKFTILIDEEKETYQEKIVKFDHVFKNEQTNEIYLILQKNRDIYSYKKASEMIEKFINNTEVFVNHFQDNKVNAFLWFMDENYKNNQEFFANILSTKINDNISYHIYYAHEFFKHLDIESVWDTMVFNLNKFKNENSQELFIKPNLDLDPEALEVLVNLSNSSWEKLNSDSPVYKELRTIIFDDKNPNSNLLKAYEIRKIKANSKNDEEFKNNMLEYSNINK